MLQVAFGQISAFRIKFPFPITGILVLLAVLVVVMRGINMKPG